MNNIVIFQAREDSYTEMHLRMGFLCLHDTSWLAAYTVHTTSKAARVLNYWISPILMATL